MKKQRFLFPLLMALVMMAMSPMKSWALGGSGTASSPYTIANAADLKEFADIVNGTNGKTRNVAACAKLTADINLGNAAWKAMGSSSYAYTGTFDGQGHTISGLSITASSNNVGLFAFINGATIKNFTLAGTIESPNYSGVGSAVGRANGASKILDVQSSVNITVNGAHENIGGIVGWIESTTQVSGCTYTGTLDAGSSYKNIGGIVGYTPANAKNKITNCFFAGTIITTATGSNNETAIGGILGYVSDETSGGTNFQGLSGCFHKGTLPNCTTKTNVAAIIGRPRGSSYQNVKNNTYLSGTADKILGNDYESKCDASNKAITISVTANNNTYGSVTKSYVNPTSSAATQLKVEATPNTGYHFDYWSDSGAQTHNVSLAANVSSTANFGYFDTEASWSWSPDGKSATCTRTCKTDGNHKSSKTVTYGNGITSKVATAATCTSKGTTTYTATATVEGKSYTDSHNVVDIAVLSHTYSSKTPTSTYIASEATCTANATYYYKCSGCSAKGTSTWEQTNSRLEHNMTPHAAVEPCAYDGNHLYYTCSQSCCSGKYYKDNALHTTNAYAGLAETVIPAVGHHFFAANDAAESECTACHHGFFRYTSNDNDVVQPHQSGYLLDADSLTLKIISNTYNNGQGVIEFNKPLVTIGDRAFQDCSRLTGDLVIPSSVTSIGTYAFLSTNFTTIINYAATPQKYNNMMGYNIPNITLRVPGTSLASYKAASGWKNFSTITCISHNVQVFEALAATCGEDGHDAGKKCSDCGEILEGLTIHPATGKHTFAQNDPTQSVCTVCHHGFFRYTSNDNDVVQPYRPGNLLDADSIPLTIISNTNIDGQGIMEFERPLVVIGYDAFFRLRGFTGSLTIPSSVTSIEDYAFYNCTGFTGNLVIPSSVESIGNYAFLGCSGFTGDLVIPNSVESIGKSAFDYCSGFNGTLTLSDKLESIGENAFYNCYGFTGDLVIPNSVESIGDYAFDGCSGFTGNLVIPDNVTSIGEYAFAKCSGFNGTLTLSDKLTSIEDYAFYYCTGFTGDLVIPNSVESIEDYAFYYCTGFTGNLVIPENVTSIGECAFAICSGTGVEMRSVPKIGASNAFYQVKGNKTVVLSDDSYVYTGSNSNFPSVMSPSYTRTMSAASQWGTVVLPFDAVSNEDVQLYQLTGVTSDQMTFTPVDNVAANTPCVFKKKHASATSVTFTGNNVSSNIPATPSVAAGETGWTAKGTYSALSNQTGMYFIAQNKFWKADAPITIAPFRAWFECNIGAGAKALNIVVEEDDADGILNITDQLDGRDGKYLENGHVVIVKNGKKFNLNGQKIK